jgi:hypothetical protein
VSNCKHEKLMFCSGGYYIQCLECFKWWVAIKHDVVSSDSDLDYSRGSDCLSGEFRTKQP